MLTCSGCIRTYLRTTFSDVLYPTYSGYVAVSPRRSTRFASTVPKKEPWLQRGSLRDSTRVKYDQRRKEPPVKLHAVQGGDRRNRLISSSANGRPGGRSRGLKKSNLKKELLYLQDPLQLADKTLHLLNQGDYQKALEMVRVAGNNFKCTVSWNHLINDNMNHGNIAWAIKLYNDVCAQQQL